MYNWSVRPCYDCWWYSGNHRWTRTLPIGPPRSTSRKIVLFVPRPWYRRCRRHNRQATPLTCLACMITQDVSALPTSNPHGGPITHRSTGSKPDSPVHPHVSKVIPRAWTRMKFMSHLPNALFWYHPPYLLSLLWTPFSLWFRLRATIYPLGTSYCTFVPYSRCILYVQLER